MLADVVCSVVSKRGGFQEMCIQRREQRCRGGDGDRSRGRVAAWSGVGLTGRSRARSSAAEQPVVSDLF